MRKPNFYGFKKFRPHTSSLQTNRYLTVPNGNGINAGRAAAKLLTTVSPPQFQYQYNDDQYNPNENEVDIIVTLGMQIKIYSDVVWTPSQRVTFLFDSFTETWINIEEVIFKQVSGWTVRLALGAPSSDPFVIFDLNQTKVTTKDTVSFNVGGITVSNETVKKRYLNFYVINEEPEVTDVF